ncbi:hypothetical protein [uncultured Actinomyces sp.]|uniref:hypothetical protein n=1 Tax=uncultured Actinomyces sp. TaxID=249061 RepID=UPI00288C3CD4|nr:hypothetical protein [uncultured Actinomyces sp.]
MTALTQPPRRSAIPEFDGAPDGAPDDAPDDAPDGDARRRPVREHSDSDADARPAAPGRGALRPPEAPRREARRRTRAFAATSESD